jgi:hypothetical protein
VRSRVEKDEELMWEIGEKRIGRGGNGSIIKVRRRVGGGEKGRQCGLFASDVSDGRQGSGAS